MCVPSPALALVCTYICANCGVNDVAKLDTAATAKTALKANMGAAGEVTKATGRPKRSQPAQN